MYLSGGPHGHHHNPHHPMQLVLEGLVLKSAQYASHGGRELGRTLSLVQERGLHPTIRHIAAGVASRTLAQVTIHPIDTIKTRVQLALELFRRSGGVPGTLRDLYLGVGGGVCGMIPTQVLYFSGYEMMSRTLKDHMRDPETLELPQGGAQIAHVCSAAFGAILSTIVRVPSDVIKHKVQAYKYANELEALTDIWAKQGVKGFYKGLGATMVRDVPELIIQFSVYEALRKAYRKRSNEPCTPQISLALGACAGACAAFITSPLDMMKTALQVGNSAGKSGPQVLAEAFANKGLKGLFAGAAPRVLMTATMSGVFFFTFEEIKRRLPEAPETDFTEPLVIGLRPSPAKILVSHLEEAKPFLPLSEDVDADDLPLIGPLLGDDEFAWWEKSMASGGRHGVSLNVAPSQEELKLRSATSVAAARPSTSRSTEDAAAAAASSSAPGPGPMGSGPRPRSSPGQSSVTLPSFYGAAPIASPLPAASAAARAPGSTAGVPIPDRPASSSAGPRPLPQPLAQAVPGSSSTPLMTSFSNAPASAPLPPLPSKAPNNLPPLIIPSSSGPSFTGLAAPRLSVPFSPKAAGPVPGIGTLSEPSTPRTSHLPMPTHALNGLSTAAPATAASAASAAPELIKQAQTSTAAGQLRSSTFRRPPVKRSSSTIAVTCGFSLLADEDDTD